MEKWKDAKRYEGLYQVSDSGRLRNRKGRILKSTPKGGKYVQWCLYRGKSDAKYIVAHRLIWESFKEPIGEGLEVNHLNGIKHDNRLENLEPCTPSENCLHRCRVLGKKSTPPLKKGEANGNSKLCAGNIREIFEMKRAGVSFRKIANRYGVSQGTICFIVNGETWKEEGLPFREALLGLRDWP